MKKSKVVIKPEDPISVADALMDELKILPDPVGEFKRALEKKYRLEWNFHSNHIEGNTLTYGQTELLLFRGKAVGDHEKQEYDEMQAHDVAIEMVKDWAKDQERDLTEKDLRELNKVLLVRPFWKEAITQDGQQTRKKIIPGEYKSTPNSVQLKNGQIHHYASPEEAPARMQELFEWYNKQKDIHPIIKAAFAHHVFTDIHPFDDGNGRVARLWANFILLKAGYPPLIVRTENKEEYLTALEQADVGDMDHFVMFMAEELQWSIQLSIKAAKGEEVEESRDLEKEISLFKKQIESRSDKIPFKTPELVIDVFEKSIRPLLVELNEKLNEFNDLFGSFESMVMVNNTHQHNSTAAYHDTFRYVDKIIKDNKVALFEEAEGLKTNHSEMEIKSLTYDHDWKSFTRNGINPFNLTVSLEVVFDEGHYRVHNKGNLNLYHKSYLYNDKIGEVERARFVKSYVRYVMDQIDIKIKKSNMF